MFREVKKKMVVLNGRGPFSPAVLEAFGRLSLEDFVYTNMRLEGRELTRDDVVSILDGNVKKDITIEEHMMIRRFCSLKEEMTGMIEMQTSLNLRSLRRLYAAIAGIPEEEVRYRASNVYLSGISYSMPAFSDVPDQMEILEDELMRPDQEHNELFNAAMMHCRILEIFPFEKYNGILARTVLYYCMMQAGYPIFAFNFSKAEYEAAVARYLRDENIDEFYRGLERSLYNKMEQLLELTERKTSKDAED